MNKELKKIWNDAEALTLETMKARPQWDSPNTDEEDDDERISMLNMETLTPEDMDAWERANLRAHRERRLREAKRRGDYAAIGKIVTADKKLEEIANEKPGRGRQPGQFRSVRKKGQPDPGDYDAHERENLEFAAHTVEQIKAYWQKRFGRKNRGEGQRPTAIEIAAKCWPVGEERLINFIKEKSRSRS